MRKIILIVVLLANGFISAYPQVIGSAEIDSVVEKVLKTFDVPGIAVGVVKDGKLVHSKGYGLRSLNKPDKVDSETLFGIASNSKAFTTAALGMMVEEGKLKWDDKVTDYIPEFRLYNPYVTEEFTVRDLLTHRSGLGLGAGDLMFFPDSNNFTLNEVIHNLRYLKAVSGFRTKYDYDNLLYIVAGEVLARVSGMSWEDFIRKRILLPLQMNNSAASFSRLPDRSNVVDPHAPIEGKVKVIRRDWSENANAAGGIYSNITDLSKWVIMQLNNGKYGEGKQLFSESLQQEMWTLQTIIPVNGPSSYNTHFAGYGLGWFLADVKGYKQVSHTGGLAGIVTQVTLIPELKLGIIVLTNQQSGAAFSAITNTIKDSYFGMKGFDRIKEQHDRVVRNESNAARITGQLWASIDSVQRTNTKKTDVQLYTGLYRDKWFGDVEISVKNGKLWFDSKKSPQLTGEMFAYKGNTFIVKWTDRSMDADAFVKFDLDNTGSASGMKMEAISPLTDFSFDFQDLEFVRKK
jgi:CubicO group peptidase (beta-lactamase class C family)